MKEMISNVLLLVRTIRYGNDLKKITKSPNSYSIFSVLWNYLEKNVVFFPSSQKNGNLSALKKARDFWIK